MRGGFAGGGQGLIHAPVPMHVEDLLRKHVVEVAAGATHSLAVTRDGLVYAWGSCANGQLGLEVLSLLTFLVQKYKY